MLLELPGLAAICAKQRLKQNEESGKPEGETHTDNVYNPARLPSTIRLVHPRKARAMINSPNTPSNA